jgi:RNA polymerase sigma-70 factor, ECF subfamily
MTGPETPTSVTIVDPGITRAAPADSTDVVWDDWVARLGAQGMVRDEAMRRLHALMLRAARHQLARMSDGRRLGRVRLEEIAQSAADDATMAVLSRLEAFEGRSRFTTWAFKFGILQAAVELRRAAWKDREVELDAVAEIASDTLAPEAFAVATDFTEAVRAGIDNSLTPHQRRVLLALVVEGIPIDVLAERLGSNRNALYKTLHDARTRLRAALTAGGYLAVTTAREEATS